LKTIFDLKSKEKRLLEIENIIKKDSFWNNFDNTTEILKERTYLSLTIEKFKKLKSGFEDGKILLELSAEEKDAVSYKEAYSQIKEIEIKIKTFSIELILNGKDDKNNAIISINSGAGGTEAQDWAEILFRMYIRWAERRGYNSEIIDIQHGDEAGIKSVTFSIKGEYAYGYLKFETGVHRLVRISPFNANGKRHTSFASVSVYPEISKEININIEESDIRIDVFRASGAGGQHVNKTSSAVRITHIPTGIIVSCQQEKSQHRNREIATKVLMSRLYKLEESKLDEKKKEIHDNKNGIAWGNQIRSYVMHPYQMVKDHRTNYETGNITAVLDGDIDNFIEKNMAA